MKYLFGWKYSFRVWLVNMFYSTIICLFVYILVAVATLFNQ